MRFWRSKEDAVPLPPSRPQATAGERAFVRQVAAGVQAAQLANPAREQEDALEQLADRVAVAVEEFLGTPEGRTYLHVLKFKQLPPSAPDCRTPEEIRYHAFLRGR